MTLALLGIDIGTSGCKALLIDADGAVLASSTATYPLAQPRPGWTEQDPALWIDGARRSVAGVLEAVHLVGVPGTGPAPVPGEPPTGPDLARTGADTWWLATAAALAAGAGLALARLGRGRAASSDGR